MGRANEGGTKRCWRTPLAGGVPKNPPFPGGQSSYLQMQKYEPNDWIRSES